MEAQTTPPLGYDPEWARRIELEKAVLVHLTENGSAKWGAIYSQFDQDGRGEIGETLFRLAHKKHIMVELDGTAMITASGLRELKVDE